MSHQANPDFWKFYHQLPTHIQKLADQNFALLKNDPRYPLCTSKKSADIDPFGSAITTEPWVSSQRRAFCGTGSARMQNMIA